MDNVIHLAHLLESAITAHRGTSFSPEKRGDSMITQWDEVLCSDLERIKDSSQDLQDHYKQRFIQHFTKWLSAKSRIMSTMITGGSNFPVRRMQKYNNWEDSAYKSFNEWRAYKINSILRGIENSRPQEEKDNLQWEQIRKNMMRSIQTIRDIDSGVNRGSIKSLFVKSITGTITTLAKNRKSEMVNRCLELIREENKKGVIITDRNSIWSLEIPAEEVKKENKEFPFEGGSVTVNYEAGRIQVSNDTKPGSDIIQKYKKLGFKWSPSNSAWQVFIHQTGAWKVFEVTGIRIEI